MITIIRMLLGLLLAIPVAAALLYGIDSFYEPVCEGSPPPGTVILTEGERMEILPSGGQDVLVLDVLRKPDEDPDEAIRREHGHYHPKQEERFQVIRGELQILIGDELRRLGPGDAAVVPANTLHNWTALGDSPVRVRATLSPALDVDLWFVHFKKHVARGNVDLMQAAVITREYGDSSLLPADPPPFVWKVASHILAPIGRMMGYQAC